MSSSVEDVKKAMYSNLRDPALLQAAKKLSGKQRPSIDEVLLTNLIFDIKKATGLGERYYPIRNAYYPDGTKFSAITASSRELLWKFWGEDYYENLPDEEKPIYVQEFMKLGPLLTTLAGQTASPLHKRLGVVMANQSVLVEWASEKYTTESLVKAYAKNRRYVGLLAFGNTNGDVIAAYLQVQRDKWQGGFDKWNLRMSGYTRNHILSPALQLPLLKA